MYHTYRIKIGAVSALIVADMQDFPESPDEQIQSRFPTLPPEILHTIKHDRPSRGFSKNILYLEGDGRRVLIDTGEGMLVPQRPGQAIAALQAAGVNFAAVDTVVITHFHGDHFGGLVDSNGALYFPNASILVSNAEWQYWMNNPALPPERTATLRSILEPLQPTIRLIDASEWITPSIGAIALPGHTPGHIGIQVNSDGDQLLHLVDALHMPFQIQHPEISPRFDSDPLLAADTRRLALARAADEDLLVMGYHLPFPGLGYVSHPIELEPLIWEPLE